MEISLHKSESNEKEILEMILQFFYENKYIESAKLLESKANIIYDQNEILNLKNLLKDHKFDESVKFLESSNLENVQKAEVLKILKTRKFLELIKSNNRREALEYIRTEIAPLQLDMKTLNKYSVILFDKHAEHIEKYLINNFSEIYNDELLINKVQSLLCLSIDSSGNRILPNSRLETLLNTYHNLQNSMYTDENVNYYDSKNLNNFAFKNFRYFSIEKHDDEVWHLEMSYNNKYLATCSRNGMISIFGISIEENTSRVKVECLSYFLAHKKYLTCLQWSKSDKFILTSSADKSIKLWDPFQGKCLKTYLLHSDIVTSVKWLNEETFVSGGIDKKMIICTTSNRVLSSEIFSRIRKVLVSDALNCVVIIPASMNDIIFYDLINYREINRLTELDPIISSNLSKYDDGRYLISNTSKVNANINLYDLTTFRLLNKFYGHTQEQFCIECSFAGINDEFIICGSEDASIYIWHRSNSIPISVVKGHTGSVNNCLLYMHKQIPFVFSVSDDFTLRLWITHDAHIEYEDLTVKKSNRKISDVYKEHNKNDLNNNLDLLMNEFNNLVETEQLHESNRSVSGDEIESEMSN